MGIMTVRIRLADSEKERYHIEVISEGKPIKITDEMDRKKAEQRAEDIAQGLRDKGKDVQVIQA